MGPPRRSGFTELELDAALRPLPGTIPVPRYEFKEYVESGGEYSSLSEFIENIPEPTPNVTSDSRLYGAHKSTNSNTRVEGYINLWRYAQVQANQMSLLQSFTGSSAAGSTEAVEVGFQVSPNQYSDTDLHFFTYFRTNGSAEGNRIGGYNLTVQGFKTIVGAPSVPGAKIDNSTVSTLGGTQYECKIRTWRRN